ncbi:MAG: YaiI/YqxD family protein [Rhodobacteraceae bacterium]|nr:YaiI/YqxD family protein [Paracoccaceae bacterium]
MRILVDADACPVKSEVARVAARRGVAAVMVSDGGVRPSAFPEVEMVYVAEGPDAADNWIAEAAAPGDVCVTADIPLAARAIEAGATVLTFSGEVLNARNIGPRLAQRDLMASLRSADPFFQGSGGGYTKADRSRFLQALDRALS